MDVLITFVIILIIVLAVAPFFLLSGEFGAKKASRNDRTGPVTPVPGVPDDQISGRDEADSGAGDAAGDGDGAGD